jgi:pSer/pThr/pTyr-binding forkhead associated (FHA) protein
VIVCPRCNKENQDHYKFCLGCGSELPRSPTQAPKAFTAQTPPRGVPTASKYSGPTAPAAEASNEPKIEAKAAPTAGEKQLQYAKTQVRGTEPTEPPAPIGEPAAPVIAATPTSVRPTTSTALQVACPSCGNPVPADFKFCGTCGHRMEGAGTVNVPPSVKPAAAVPGKPMTATAAKSTSPAVPASPARRGVLVLINPDGSEGASFALQGEKTVVGRDSGAPFTGDVFLSPVHAVFTFKGNKLHVKDQSSLNGVYVKLEREMAVTLTDGAIFRIGQEILKFENLPQPKEINGVELMGSPNPGFLGRICTVIGINTIGEAFAIPPDGMHMGRERGDVTFPDDGYVSGLHCRIHKEGNQVVLTDVGSSNGTFLRIGGEHEVRNGELFLMGQQLFSARY